MSARVAFQHFLEVVVDFGAVVELFPEEGGRQQVLLRRKWLPYVSFLEGVLNDSWVVPRGNDVTMHIFVAFRLHMRLRTVNNYINQSNRNHQNIISFIH